MATVDRINQLSQERARLFREASNGHRGDPALLGRVHEIDAELEQLWELRRMERAGRAEGIDAIVDRTYARLYGAKYEESLRPLPVTEAADERAALAA
jgi:hypothetical protein